MTAPLTPTDTAMIWAAWLALAARRVSPNLLELALADLAELAPQASRGHPTTLTLREAALHLTEARALSRTSMETERGWWALETALMQMGAIRLTAAQERRRDADARAEAAA